MMKKFDAWNEQKKLIDTIQNISSFHEREIWFIQIGENVGFEQNGKGKDFLRPVLVYKKFSKNVFIGIPLTSIVKDTKFYHTFDFKERKSTAILSQVRLFDSKRLAYSIGRISKGDYRILKQKLIALLQ